MNLGGARPSTHFRITAPANFPCFFYVFDVMVLEGVDLRREPLSRLRELLEERVLPKFKGSVKYSSERNDPAGILGPNVILDSSRFGAQTPTLPGLFQSTTCAFGLRRAAARTR